MQLQERRLRHAGQISMRRRLLYENGLIADERCGRSARTNLLMYVCTFCRAERDIVAKGPGVCICGPCLAAIAGEAIDAPDDTPCSFCHQQARSSWWRSRNRSIVAVGQHGDVWICSDCAPIARGALEHNRRLAARGMPASREENHP